MNFNDLFPAKPVIACIHLLPLPGSPRYSGSMKMVIETAQQEAGILTKAGCNGLLVENFRDNPFFPGSNPAETIAALTTVTYKLVNDFDIPVGVNALRNDATAAMAIATACGAKFIRVNIHIGAAVTDQGIIEGKAHETLRLRANLRSDVLIFADVAVKHATPLAARSLDLEVRDVSDRGMADAVIVTGSRTGGEADLAELQIVKQNTRLPVLIGSGLTPENVGKYYPLMNGMIVGSFFKEQGIAGNRLSAERVRIFIEKIRELEQI